MKYASILLLLLAVPAPLPAQQPGGCEPQQPGGCEPLDALGTRTLECVDQRPRPDSAGSAVRIILRNAGSWRGFEGSFRIAFTIDTAGRVIRRTVRVLDEDTGRIAQQYPMTIASEIRYVPAMRGGVPVPVAYEQRIEYRHTGNRGGELSVPPLPLRRTLMEEPGGSTLRLEWLPVADAPLATMDADTSRARQMEAISAAIANPRWDSLAFACIAFHERDSLVRATPAEVERLRLVRPRIASPGECPPTYNTGWATFNADGTPRVRSSDAGPDPYHVAVTAVVPWTEEWVVIGLTVRHSASTERLRCEQQRMPDDRWRTECQTTSGSIF